MPAVCPECGQSLPPGPPTRIYCSPAHKAKWDRRMVTRGYALVLLGQAWRGGKSRKGDQTAAYARAELCAMLDRFNTEDREAGRPRAIEQQAARYRSAGVVLRPTPRKENAQCAIQRQRGAARV